MEASWAILEASWGHLGRLGGHLGPSWRHLGAILPVLEAILAVLEASWRPSWAILAVLEAISSHLGGFFPVVEHVEDPPGTPAGRAEAHWGSSFGKEPKPKPGWSSTLGTPVMNQQGAADLVAFGPSRHRAWIRGRCAGMEEVACVVTMPSRVPLYVLYSMPPSSEYDMC